MDDMQKKIQQRAYEIYLRRNKQPGRDMEDWIQAEREVRTELAKKPASSSAPAPERKPAPKITTTFRPAFKKK
jgi:hypothetical protein